ncbi:hypothetical protein D3C80_1323580 [compost metagenome]
MQAAEAARRTLLQVVEHGDEGEMLVVDARQYVERAHQLLQPAGDAVQQFVGSALAVLEAVAREVGNADQQVAQRAAAGFQLAQAVRQLLPQVAQVAETGGGVHQVALLQPGDVLGEQAVFHQQTLQGVAQTVGGEHAGHQLFAHR